MNGRELARGEARPTISAGHLTNAINIPFNEIETAVSAVVALRQRKAQRHGVEKLSQLGYTNAFNLGSYGRAKSLLNRQN